MSGRVRKPFADMPLRQCSQALPQGIDGQYLSMISEIACNAVGGRRQEAAPFDLEVADGGLVALARVVAGSGIEVLVELAHTNSCSWPGLHYGKDWSKPVNFCHHTG